MNSKSVFLLCILLLTVLVNQAQTETSNSTFYVKVYGGYGLIQPGSYKLVSTDNNTTTGNVTGNTSLSSQGLGSGVRFGGGVGIIASDFLNIGADVEYLSGTTLNSSSNYASTSGYNSFINTSFSYTSLSITPHVIFKALSKPDYLIYNKLGILLNLPMDLKKTQYDSSFNTTVISTYTSHIAGTYKIGLTVGLNVALGVQVRLTDQLRAYGEIFGNYLVLSPTNYDETNAVVYNGTPTAYDTHITYVKSGQTTYSTNGNTTNYSTSVSGNTFNMNSIGINIGVTYRF
jgi:hypothetical protein